MAKGNKEDDTNLLAKMEFNRSILPSAVDELLRVAEINSWQQISLPCGAI